MRNADIILVERMFHSENKFHKSQHKWENVSRVVFFLHYNSLILL